MRKSTFAVFALILALAVGLCVCSTILHPLMFYVSKEYGDFCYGYSDIARDAFVISYIYTPEAGTEIRIPESYKGYLISELGGDTGAGVPSPFFISLSGLNLDVNLGSEWNFCQDYDPETTDVYYYDFTLYIGANIREIDARAAVEVYEPQEGENARTAVYIPRVHVCCHEDNSVFYAENGRLYYKDGTLVEGFIYHDQTLF